MRYFLIAGDPSGDQHGARLVTALREKDPHAEFVFFGGEWMQKTLRKAPVVSLEQLAFMGFTQLLSHLRQIRDNFRLARKTLRSFQPDAFILIDYAGFNLRMAKWAYYHGFKCFFYISPKVWAWRKNRSKLLKKYCEKVLCILPFEPDFLHSFKVNAVYTGNPVVEEITPWLHTDRNKTLKDLGLENRPMVALLPGSRDQEIRAALPIMAQMQSFYPEYQFVVAGHQRFPDDYYQRILHNTRIPVKRDVTQELLSVARAALVTSGTATLEVAWHQVPQVVCYRTYPLSYWIARWLIRVKYISLVNLIADKKVVTELIQKEFNAKRLRETLADVLHNEDTKQQIEEGYRIVKSRVGTQISSRQTARYIFESLSSG